MNTKSFVGKLNQITKALFSMTPAQREKVHQSIQALDKVYHIQTVNGAIANFKGWINGKMKGLATEYLPNYLAWFKKSNAKLDKQEILFAAYG